MANKNVKQVLAFSNLPTRLPLGSTVLYCTVLDYWNAPQWLWGAFGVLYGIIWMVSLYDISREQKVDLLKNDE